MALNVADRLSHAGAQTMASDKNDGFKPKKPLTQTTLKQRKKRTNDKQLLVHRRAHEAHDASTQTKQKMRKVEREKTLLHVIQC